MSSTNRRREGDVMKLMMSDFKVDFLKDGMHEFHVEFHGPKDSPYQGGVWKVYVRMNENYPYKAPTIKFANRIFHPNIDEKNGSICLDVMDQKWSPMFALINVFELFLPQLLLYPNPGHPLNGDAAALMRENLTTYEQKVKEHCQNHAKPVEVEIEPEKESSDDEQSELSSDDEDATIP